MSTWPSCPPVDADRRWAVLRSVEESSPNGVLLGELAEALHWPPHHVAHHAGILVEQGFLATSNGLEYHSRLVAIRHPRA